MTEQAWAPKAYTTTRWWGREDLDLDVWEAALERTRFAYDHYDVVEVSFSGGKDSMAVLEAAIIVAREKGRLPVRTLFADEEANAPTTEDYVRRTAARPEVDLVWYTVPVWLRNAASSETSRWFPWDPDLEHLWVRERPPEGVTLEDLGIEDPGPDGRWPWPIFYQNLVASEVRAGTRQGKTAIIMGIRADESMVRRKAVANARRENYVMPGSVDFDKVYTIYDWDTTDIWSAARIHEWDHNEAYDHFEMLGINVRDQRVAPPFGQEPLGNMYMFAVLWPELWDRLAFRVPGAATAARYSKTDLYGFGGLPEKPDGEDWRPFIRRIIENQKEHNEKILRAQQVAKLIGKHHATSPDDPLLYEPHPNSGVGWKVLLKIAVRGDLYGRIGSNLDYSRGEHYGIELSEYRETLAGKRENT